MATLTSHGPSQEGSPAQGLLEAPLRWRNHPRNPGYPQHTAMC